MPIIKRITCTAIHFIALILPCVFLNKEIEAVENQVSSKTFREVQSPLQNKNGKKIANVVFKQLNQGVEIWARIENLEPNKNFSLHVHEGFSCSGASFNTVGEPFNPLSIEKLEAKPLSPPLGNIGSLRSNSRGIATISSILPNATLNEGVTALVGRSIVLQSEDIEKDSLGLQSDMKIACGTVGPPGQSGFVR